eukprot:CAMPEP_0113501996 /NCGR_PEP_ID=MMETSP0014_2-20120614/33291_1 /TAXON_ID=2857 /ORGANISM="Nitzschia sp." /LENGTH=844 /DNA_ID=CAMNT_0000396699 /DNA_START=155 /DNA_END=2689 /DNA_ORIENTATION=- /assembly_acc=CAM_ASM_000159
MPQRMTPLLGATAPHSEFSEIDEDVDGQGQKTTTAAGGGTDLRVRNEDAVDVWGVKYNQEEHFPDGGQGDNEAFYDSLEQHQPRRNSNHWCEYGALRPGTTVKIQVGDVALARKAWKKRRRSGSPLLVPCSILDVDRKSMVRWNLIFLLEKFGRQSSKNNKKSGIEISVSELAKKYRFYLKSSFERQVQDLGYESKHELMKDLFNQKVQESYGVRLVEKQLDNNDDEFDTMLYLQAPISRLKGQSRTKNAPLLQFRLDQDNGGNADGDDHTLFHTGYIRALKEESAPAASSTEDSDVEATNNNNDEDDDDEDQHKQRLRRAYTFLPLSAALRVSQRDDMETSMVEQGRIYTAVVFDYAKIGDGGSPLLTLSLNAVGARDNLKIKPDKRFVSNNEQRGAGPSINNNKKNNSIKKPKLMIDDLKVGSGPYRAKVVKMVRGRAIVRLDVAKDSETYGDNSNHLLGSLHFRDAVVPDSCEANLKQDEQSNKFSTSFMDFSDDEIDGDDDEDLEDLIASSIDDLDAFDDDDDEEEEDGDEDDDEDFNDLNAIYEGNDDSNDDLVDELLSLRSIDSFEEGTFEEGEFEEDISHLFRTDENGNLLYDEAAIEVVGEDAELDGEIDDDYEDEDDEDTLDEDISQMYAENSDGSITFHDPETGESLIIDENDPTFEDLKTMASLINDDNGLAHTEAESKTEAKEKHPESKPPHFVGKKLHLGDIVDVYVLSISKQSGQCKVTTNPLVRGQNAKELKKQGHALKKKSNLKRKLGGSLKKINSMKGKELTGVVKAASKNWVYIQPESQADLPVGIATMEEELVGLTAGDNVRIEVAGIDSERGQLSLKLISKCTP